ncbi:MAG TPA: hypothetical protein PKZ97_11030, partial [Azospirillaceae bacterium]|nr:hypothetical protein [Azospirillaceae bacterium]
SRARRSDEPLLADAGALVKGEWVDADGAGLLLHPDPDAPGCLIRWRYAERLLTDNAALQSEEIPALRERIVVLAPPIPKQPPSKEALQPVLVYHVFWGADDPGDPHAIHRLFHRFAGFAEENVVIRQPRRNTP